MPRDQIETTAALAVTASRREGLTLFALLSCSFIATLDFFIVAVAIPSIRAQLSANDAQLEWVVAGYGLAFAAMLVAAGKLGERYGRVRILRLGVIGFALTSVACGLAPDPSSLILARVLQGVTAAAMSPQVLGLINLTYKGPRRAWALSWLGVALGLAATLGQIIGGGLIESGVAGLGWRLCFLINPLLAAVPLCLLRKGAFTDVSSRTRLDTAAMVMFAMFLVCLAIPLIEGRRLGWTPGIWVWTAAAAVILAGLCIQQRRGAQRGDDPLFRPALMRNPTFVRSALAALVFYAGNASFYFVIGLYLQAGRGLGPLLSGAVFATLTAGFFAGSLLAPRLMRSHGFTVITLGAVLLVAAHALQLAWGEFAPAYTAWVPLGVLLAAEGFGIGLLMTPLTGLALSSVPPENLGVASGIFATTQWIGNSLGVALIGIPFFSAAAGHGHAAYQNAFNAALIYLLVTTLLFIVLARRALPACTSGPA